MYGEHLDSNDWVVRAMAVISVAEIDDPRTTQMLLEVASGDEAPFVRAAAWDALMARRQNLTDDQRQLWMQRGRKMLTDGDLRGNLRVGAVRSLIDEGPTPENEKLLDTLFADTNVLNPADAATLCAMRQVVAAWKTPKLIDGLIRAMRDIDSAYRAEFLLRGLKSDIPHSSSRAAQGSQRMWAATYKAWKQWRSQTDLAAVSAADASAPGAIGAVLPPPEKIADPRDPRWRKDLELRPLRLKQLDVVFAVDSTGSMSSAIEWIQQDVARMMRALGVISREPRIGIVLYRDRGDLYVVKEQALTGDGRKLAAAIAGAEAGGGGDMPEAVYSALRSSVGNMNWAADHRFIIVVGDAPPHEEDMPAARRLVASASRSSGFRFHFMCVGREIPEFAELAEAGNGTVATFNFRGAYSISVQAASSSGPREEDVFATARTDDSTPDAQILGQIMRTVLNEPYHDRVDRFVALLLQFAAPSPAEKRAHFGSGRFGGGMFTPFP
jgi:hypothetical protein